ncbi:DEAD/DEAH box helicase family protein [Ornithinimicrobium sediminis]|uniref:DEAD/DEAH box helicase family protein n=1 Tax=Ornithinimicrobium sediminis TaxID=2904603 RepID=UPI001E326407|nr:DEAD/DEAH box helicase family protein [Ornithinimicrobium sediminis]MCE0487825.1 DEAD/DEAH box helicase family protein [Ornithinimicrobium sediminis]
MGNFDFVRQTLPSLHDDCARAESYLSSDPRSACFYSRRVVEELVGYLYTVLSLPIPYRDDLAAKINDAAFKATVPQGITQKLTAIRRIANTAVHETRQIRPDVSLAVLRELFHVVVWTSYHHSPEPAVVPLQAQFDPALAAKAAPLSREEVARLATKFQEQDDAHARQLAQKDERLAAHLAEIAVLKAQIATAQAETAPDTRDYDEAAARDLFIDVLLQEAGWTLDQDRDREYEVTGMPNAEGRGFVDYVLWGADGLPLAVVEAKRTSKSPEVGQQQAKLYADCLEKQYGRRPVIFYTNGYEHRIWDDAGYPPREIQGFYTRDELELLIQRRQTKLPLSSAQVNTDIAGRPYQVRAIKAVGDAFDRKQREALLVMATGSGKTRTTIALVDLLQKANWVKRVLFLADRTALVNQAANGFKEHLPGSTTVNLVVEKAVEGRVYISTYPTMMNLVNEVDSGRRRFGPGYFDLIVIDEAHRSVYAKYGAIFDYFDAHLVGLTATPKDEVDHNTYRLFHLEDGVPTDNYSLDEAVDAGYLVPPKGFSVGTQFLRSGIKYDDLTEDEKDEWDALDWGEDGPPEEVGAEELNRFLFNEDTVDKVLETLMTQGHKVASGDRLGKTIIFAKGQKHAEFIEKRFNLAYPELAGHFARVITYGTPYAQSLIDDFSVKDKAPHIAISVDMLDTGIDVPEVVNLVFFKMVRSKSKFWQMIGRGTRLSPDLFGPGDDKEDFLVFDFCGNLEYFSQDLPGSPGQSQKSLSQRLFEARLGLLIGLGDTEPALRTSTASTLHEVVAGMNLDNFVVRPHRRTVEKYAAADAWKKITAEDSEALLAVAGLPSSVRDEDEDAKRFDLLVLRRQLAQLDGDAVLAERLRETVQQIAAALLGKTTIPSVAEQAVLLELVAGDEWWIDVTLPMLEEARRKLRGLVRFIEKTSRNPVYTHFEDILGEGIEVVLPRVTPGTNFERFRAKAEAYLREHLDNLTLQRLRRNKQLTPDDLTALEQMLVASGGQHVDIAWATEQGGGLGIFVRNLVGLDRSAAIEAFEKYLDNTKFSAAQVRFVNLIVDELTKNGVMDPARLFESPYTDHAPTGPDYFFPDAEVEVIVETLHHIKQTAVPGEVA